MSAASSHVRSAQVPGFRITDVRYGPGFRTPLHDHEHTCATVVLGGAFAKDLRGSERALPVGAVAVTPAETPHRDRFGPVGGRALVLELLDASNIPKLDEHGAPTPSVASLGHRLAAELRATDEAATLALQGAALELLAVLSRAHARTERRAPRWLEDVTEYVHAHRFERITLEELAAIAGVHRTHLARTFRAFHGLSVGAYLRRLRIEWAAQVLLDDTASLAQVAAAAGFADQSHFTRTFASHYGVSPGRWRAERRRAR